MKYLGAGMLTLLAGSLCLAAEVPALIGGEQRPEQPAKVVLDENSGIGPILDALHQRADGLKNFVADLAYEEMDDLSGDMTTSYGRIWAQNVAPGDWRIRVSFDRRVRGERNEKGFRREYLLANGLLIERDHQRKTQVTRRVLKPGQKMDLFKLGEGPFPLPIGQPRADVLRNFGVTKVDRKSDDPANTLHITLTPKEGTQFAKKFKGIDGWVDIKTHFPIRIRTTDMTGNTIRTTNLGETKLNAGLTEKDFTLDKAQGWEERLEED